MKFLITAGPTHEHLDPVRFLANASSGKMGFALARESQRKGHEVTLVAGPVALEPPEGVTLIRVTSAEEMGRAVLRSLPGCDCLIMAAAVADFRPLQRSRGKIPRDRARWTLELVPTPDILADARRGAKETQVLVGFSLETEPGDDRARRKMREKGLDLMIRNEPKTIGQDRIDCHLLRADDEVDVLTSMPKTAAARRIIRAAEKIWKDRNRSARPRGPR